MIVDLQRKGPLQSFHRAEFLEVLLLHAPPHFRTHFGKRLVSYEDCAPSPVILHFKDGTVANCDVLIGADGVKSAVRRSMFTQLAEKEADAVKANAYLKCVEATWTGMVAYRSLVASEDLEAEYPNHCSLRSPIYVSGIFQISDRRLSNC